MVLDEHIYIGRPKEDGQISVSWRVDGVEVTRLVPVYLSTLAKVEGGDYWENLKKFAINFLMATGKLT